MQVHVYVCAGGAGCAGRMGNLHQSNQKSSRIIEGTLQTVCSGCPAVRTDQKEENVEVLQRTNSVGCFPSFSFKRFFLISFLVLKNQKLKIT